MAQNHACWWASYTVGLPKQRQVHCFGSPTLQLAHQHVLYHETGSCKGPIFEFGLRRICRSRRVETKSKCGLAWSVLLSTTIRYITVVNICCGQYMSRNILALSRNIHYPSWRFYLGMFWVRLICFEMRKGKKAQFRNLEGVSKYVSRRKIAVGNKFWSSRVMAAWQMMRLWSQL